MVWHEVFRVRSYETDPHARASVPSLCHYLQEAAGNHARDLGVSVEHLAEADLTWVLSRLHVVLDRQPAWREDVHLHTWPTGENGLYAYRAFLLQTADGTVWGRATSAWLLMHRTRRRPVRIPPMIREIRLPDRPSPLPEAFERLTAPEAFTRRQSFRVHYADLDMNQHLNNVRYIAWALDGIAPVLEPDYRLAELEIQFRAEATLGDAVVAESRDVAPVPRPVVAHRLSHAETDRDLALARSVWEPRA
ncbi:MAG: acyl-ACP thioesterase [Bacteroidetes bacterium]|nr:MAG: acyl-ACP thioesterase [Bacteroidota bacterium]